MSGLLHNQRCPFCIRKIQHARLRGDADTKLELVAIKADAVPRGTDAFVDGLVLWTVEPYVALEWTRPPSRVLVEHAAVCEHAA